MVGFDITSNWIISQRNVGRFPFTKNFGKFLLGILGISVWEDPFVTSPIRLQAPLRRFTKK